MKDKFDAIYAQFNMTAQSLNLARNVLGVEPYSTEGCAAILLYSFLVDSYHIPELPGSIIVKHMLHAVAQAVDVVSEEPVMLIILDKAFAIIPGETVQAVNLLDLSIVDPTKLDDVVANPITSDVISVSAILSRIILPALVEREDPAAGAAQE
jgi:hypothetical protein